jgi:hypothetical protein
VRGMDDNPRESKGGAALPRRKPGASYPGGRWRAAGIASVRVPTEERRRWVVPDESLLRRIHAGLESLR